MQAEPLERVIFQIAERTLSGSPQHVLEELDDIVETLVAFRQVMASKNGTGVRRDLRQTGTPPTAL
jgi:hypothetical protein